ncbi:MAG: fatty acid desaturase [Rhodobacteraceae bacterium]|nr:fatty acid desaturase [Paracoccaceae bacterium]
MSEQRPAVEWPTLILILLCYLIWALATTYLARLWLPLGMAVTALTVTLHSSLQHEVLHGHPFRQRLANEALVFFPLGLVYPYGRFRDLHLAHHRDESLTDPYDDPESNFMDPRVWVRLAGWQRAVLRCNNTLLGRMLIGPALAVWCVLKSDFLAILRGQTGLLRAWALHVLGLVPVILWVMQSGMPLWAYVASAYGGMAVLKIRTYLEHRAHEIARGRSVIVEGGAVLPFLFLNNNLHAVHHARPGLAWYKLPAFYRTRREEYMRRNEGYFFSSYAEIFRQYFIRAKDPVPHPLRPEN